MSSRRNEPPPIRAWYRYRVWGLAALALFCVRFGIVYTPFLYSTRKMPAALEYITAFLPPPRPGWEPVWILGCVWIALGILALLAIVWQRFHNAAFVAGSSFTLYWAFAYAANQYSADTPPGAADTLTAVFLFVGAWLLVLVGLLTRPSEEDEAVEPTSPPGWERHGEPETEAG